MIKYCSEQIVVVFFRKSISCLESDDCDQCGKEVLLNVKVSDHNYKSHVINGAIDH